MPASTPRWADQSSDGLLVAADLPDGWYLPHRFPGERDDDASAQIDAILGYDDWITTDSSRSRSAPPRRTKRSMGAGATSSIRKRTRE